jgi:hypothetical protein
MIFRRRRTRIEIEYSSLRMQTVAEAAGFNSSMQPQSTTQGLVPRPMPEPQDAPAAIAQPHKPESRQ